LLEKEKAARPTFVSPAASVLVLVLHCPSAHTGMLVQLFSRISFAARKSPPSIIVISGTYRAEYLRF